MARGDLRLRPGKGRRAGVIGAHGGDSAGQRGPALGLWGRTRGAPAQLVIKGPSTSRPSESQTLQGLVGSVGRTPEPPSAPVPQQGLGANTRPCLTQDVLLAPTCAPDPTRVTKGERWMEPPDRRFQRLPWSSGERFLTASSASLVFLPGGFRNAPCQPVGDLRKGAVAAGRGTS